MISHLKTLLYIGVPLGFLIGGWQAHSWYVEASMSEWYRNAFNEARSLYESQVNTLQAEYEAQAEQSRLYQQQRDAARKESDALREVISDANFEDAAPVADCPRNPLDSESFRLLYNAAARGGDAEAGASDSAGVSPRND